MALTRDDLWLYFEAGKSGVAPRALIGEVVEFSRASGDYEWVAGREYIPKRMAHAPVYESMDQKHGLAVRLGAANLVDDPMTPMEWTLSGATEAAAVSCIQGQIASKVSSTADTNYVAIPATGDYGADREGLSIRLEQQGTRASADVMVLDDAGASHAARLDWATGEVTLLTPSGSGLEIEYGHAICRREAGQNGGRLFGLYLEIQGTATRERSARIYPHRAANLAAAVVVHDAAWIASPMASPPCDGTRARTYCELRAPDPTGGFLHLHLSIDDPMPAIGEYRGIWSLALPDDERLSLTEFGPNEVGEFGGLTLSLQGGAEELTTTCIYERERIREEPLRISFALTDT